jgi:enoyl-CoA hydratase/carnithine racemase
MILTNRWIDAREAYDYQLVNRIVKRERLLQSAEDMAGRLASCDPAALRYAKQAVVRGADLPLPQGLDLETRLAALLMAPAGKQT